MPVEHCKKVAIHRFRLWLRVMPGFLVAGFTLLGASSAVGLDAPTEEQVKAAFLVNFPKYVDWPAETFAETHSPIVIAGLGKTKVTAELEKIVAGRSINGREIVFKRLVADDESGIYHIRFISATEERRSPNLLAKLKDGGVLTAGESNDFLERGGIINLVPRDQRITLEVNLAAADQARIKISSKLLAVASVVKGKSK